MLEEFKIEDGKAGTSKKNGWHWREAEGQTSLDCGVSQSFAVDEFEVKGGKVTVYPPEHDESQAGWYDPGRFSISWDGQ